MSSMPWIKLHSDLLDDPSLGRLPPRAKWRFIELYLYAGQCDADGLLVGEEGPLSLGEISWRLRADLATLKADVDLLIDAGLLHRQGAQAGGPGQRGDGEAGVLCVTCFAERQGRPQREKRAEWNERKRRQRAARAAPAAPVEAREGAAPSEGPSRGSPAGHEHGPAGTHAGVTVQEAEEDREAEAEREGETDTEDGARRAAVVAAAPARDVQAVRKRLKELGITQPKLDELAALHWVTVDLIDAWWLYIRTWTNTDLQVRISSLIVRLESRRMPPEEFR